MKVKKIYDIIVAGAGPAGSTAASYLAKSGHSVLLVDQHDFPRYTVGESMWVASMDLLKMIGIECQMQEEDFIKKVGSTFFWGDIAKPWSIHFIEQDNSLQFAYHVDRMKFDQILLNNSKKLGVTTSLSTKLKSIKQSKNHVKVRLVSCKSEMMFQSKFLIDATGAKSILSKKHTKDVLNRPSNLSVWSYFENVNTLSPPQDTNGLIFGFKQGWIWIFPIKLNYFSVGINLDPSFGQNFSPGNKLKKIFQLALEQCPSAQEFMQFAKQVKKFYACTFSSRNLKKYYNNRVLSIGDAACFVDPILSTGIHLGMLGGFYAARAINTIEAGGNPNQVLDAFDRFYRQDYKEMRKLTDDLIAMNGHFRDSYWQDRISWNSVSPSIVRKLRRKQCEELSTEINFEKQISLQGIHAEQMYFTTGLGKYLKLSNPNQMLTSLFNPLKCNKDYQKGTPQRSCFELRNVYRHKQTEVYTLNEIDLFILSNANFQNFVSLIQLIRNSFEVEHISNDDLTLRIGLWIERKVLKLRRQTT